MGFDTCTIPVTRWKRGKHGVLPKTEGISKLIKCTPVEAPALPMMPEEEQLGKLAGYKSTTETVCTLRLPEMPANLPKRGKKNYSAWITWSEECTKVERAASRNLQVVIKDYKLEPKLEDAPIVPRGTTQIIERTLPQQEVIPFIGPQNRKIRGKENWIPKYYAKA